MYAIIDFKGAQFKVEKDLKLQVPFLSEFEIGASIEIDKVLMLKDNDEIIIGQPTVENAKVTAEVISHYKDKKVIVFKKKRRKTYQKKQGHRQNYTEIQIKEIIK